MKRAIVFAAALLAAPAHANPLDYLLGIFSPQPHRIEADPSDHAVIACEAFIRGILPHSPHIRTVSASIYGHTVGLTISYPNPNGTVSTSTQTCAFKFHDDVRAFHIDFPHLEDVLGTIIGGDFDQMSEEERIAAVRGNDDAQAAVRLNMDMLTVQLDMWINMEQYPVRPEFTAMQP